MDEDFKPTDDIEENNEPQPAEDLDQQPDSYSDMIEVPDTSNESDNTDTIDTTNNDTVETDIDSIETAETSQLVDDIDKSEPSIVEPVAIAEPVKADTIDNIQPVAPIKPTKKNVSKSVLVILLVLVIAFLAATGAYLWRDSLAINLEQQQKDEIASLKGLKSSLQAKLDAELAKTGKVADESICDTSVISSSKADNIKASITVGNTAVLEGYMASSVNVVLAASEGMAPKTPMQAVLSITDFISDATSPWNFLLSDVEIESYANGDYKMYFPSNAIVGKSNDSKVISFSFDCDGKISTVLLVSNNGLLTQ